MESAIRFFQHQEQSWRKKKELIEPRSQPGHAAWVARQCAVWNLMAMQADTRFNDLLKSHPPPDFAKVTRPHSNRLSPISLIPLLSPVNIIHAVSMQSGFQWPVVRTTAAKLLFSMMRRPPR